MAQTSFATLWEGVDYSLHKTINILKGAISVGEYTQNDKEALLGLVYVALEQVEEARQGLDELRDCHREIKQKKTSETRMNLREPVPA